MKRLFVCILGTFYSVLTVFGFSFAHNATPTNAKEITINEIRQNTPLYLEHSSANPLGMMQSWHYSHESHSSHVSHYSHYSGR